MSTWIEKEARKKDLVTFHTMYIVCIRNWQ